MNKPLTLAALATGALLFVSPAFATTQSDLNDCRAALTEKGYFDADKHSLKFSHRKGNSRKRTVFLTLKDRDTAARQQVECVLQREDIIDLTLTP